MKFSYQWISELVDGLDVQPRELMRLITMKTAECEGVEEAGALLAEASPARVVSVEEIATGSHNRKAVVETVKYGVKTLVCGAPNCRPGLWTVYAPIGKKVIAGVESDGMLASGRELGLNADHEGIVELDGPEFGLLPDWVIEVDNKSLTHRPDLWGHFGMAREVAAITGRKIKDPVNAGLLPTDSPKMKASIEDFAVCPRYSALVFENVTVQPSPLWLQFRLEAVGLNPINNIVDVTNFVMAELSQPMHAFDADKLKGDTIYVRRARSAEKIVALNKEEYELDDSNLVIADAAGAIAIAGVIGGDESAIGDGTTRMVLESACFNATSVRKTAAKIKNRTDASMRFEKSQDPENTVRGLARAVALLQIVSPGIKLVGGLIDSYQPLPAVAPIDLSIEWLGKKLGHPVTTGQVCGILEALQFGVAESAPGVLTVTVPSWRATKDISIREDLVEEVGRMIGYGEMTPTAPMVPSVVPPANPTREFQHHLRDLVAAQGFTEAYNYSFLSDDAIGEFGFKAEDHIRVLNPIASDQALLRTSLIPGIVRNLRENRKNLETFRLFEIGHEIHKQSTPGLPQEVAHLAATVYAAKGDGSAALLELKRLAECLVPGLTLRPCPAREFEHPARAAELFSDGICFARLFELHPRIIEIGRAAILDVDLEKVEALAKTHAVKYKPLRRFPTSAFDLSVITGLRTLVGDLDAGLREYAGSDLVSMEFQRQYSGPPLEAEQKSVSFRLTVGAPDRTLSSAEVAMIRDRIIAGMRSRGFELRV
jgi:phenylalanyl-tRNA synthetase beta chain